ncbi:MAG: aminotransferase class V-fold PLP-dependent enzyme [bacterium]
MQKAKLPRREFLEKMFAGMAGASTLAAFVPIQSAFANQLSEVKIGANSFAEMRDEYLLSPQVTYFNHGSIGTMPKMVHEAHKGYLELCESNPWLYMWGGPWKEALASTRAKAAKFMGCDADEIAFTHNTTEGFNLLANGLPLGNGDEVVFSTLNHAGASQCWFHYAQTRGYLVNKFDFPIREVPGLSREDVVAIYAKNISENTRVLVFPHVDNLVGLRHPVRELAAMAHSKGVQYVAVDGAQAVGMIAVNVQELGVDFYATSPHKWLQAPKGTGLLYLRKKAQAQLSPMWVTWGQAKWKGTVRVFEDYGTRNLPEVLALGDAIDFQARLGPEATEKRRQTLWRHFYNAVDGNPGIAWRSPTSWDLATSIYTIEVEGKDSQDLFEKLYQSQGYVFRAFHAPQWNTLRISPNIYNTPEEIDRFVKLLG